MRFLLNSALLMRIWGYEQGFVVGVDNETRFAFTRLFHKFALAIVHGNLVPVPSVREISAELGGE